MRKILAILSIVLILAAPALANVSQKAQLNGDNVIEVVVKQQAWNSGSGDIIQDLGVHVTGNYQVIDQYDEVLIDGSLIQDPDHEKNVNNEMNGLNIIKVNLSQDGTNENKGKVVQSLNILVDNNEQTLNQGIRVTVD